VSRLPTVSGAAASGATGSGPARTGPARVAPRRAALAGLAACTLALSGLTTTASPASALTGPLACPSALPTASAVDGLTGTGYTVERGTTPEAFTATVLGRITDGIAPGVDMIMAELDSPALRRTGGVWSGMSGSPVYTADGQLIGAVAYGLALGPSRIAGLTPGVDLKALVDDGAATQLRGGLAARVAVPVAAGSRVGASSAATAAQVRAGFSRLELPMSLSGSTSAAGHTFADHLAARFPGARLQAGGARSATAAAPASSITAGGNLGVAMSTGDVTFAGIGTTTLVCSGKVVGFGHPMNFEGISSYSLHPATSVYVQEDPTLAPFKVANLGGIAGKVGHDRVTGVRGRLGAAPATVVVRSTLTGPGGASRTGTTLVSDRTYAPDLAAYHALANVEAVLRASGKGSAATTLTVRGTRAGGKAFTLVHPMRLADTSSIGYAVADDVYFTLARLTGQPFERVQLTSVTLSGTVTTAIRQFRATAVKVKQGDHYVKLDGRTPLTARTGRALPVRVTLEPYQGVGATRTIDLRVKAAPDSAGRAAFLRVGGGDYGYGFYYDDEPLAPSSTGGTGGLNALLRQLSSADSSTISATLQVRRRGTSTAALDLGRAVEGFQTGTSIRVVP